MFIYVHWQTNGNYHIEAFNRESDAVSYTISSIQDMISIAKPKKRKSVYNGGAPGAPVPPINGNGRQIFGDLADAADNPNNPVPINFDIHIAAAAAVLNEYPKKEIDQLSNEDNISEEFLKLKEHLNIATKEKTFENALKSIKLYEDYTTYILHKPSALHTLEDLKVAK